MVIINGIFEKFQALIFCEFLIFIRITHAHTNVPYINMLYMEDYFFFFVKNGALQKTYYF